jgi:hypothetical protein
MKNKTHHTVKTVPNKTLKKNIVERETETHICT